MQIPITGAGLEGGSQENAGLRVRAIASGAA